MLTIKTPFSTYCTEAVASFSLPGEGQQLSPLNTNPTAKSVCGRLSLILTVPGVVWRVYVTALFFLRLEAIMGKVSALIPSRVSRNLSTSCRGT